MVYLNPIITKTDNRFVSVILDMFVIRICNLIDFGHDIVRIDQDLQGTILQPTYSTSTILNISDEPGFGHQ